MRAHLRGLHRQTGTAAAGQQARPTAGHRHRQTAGHRLTHARTRSRQQHSAGHRHGRPTAGHRLHPCPSTRKDRSHSTAPPQPARQGHKPNARTRSNTRARANTPTPCPSPKRRRVLLAAGGSFAGSRAQKLVRYDTIFSFPVGPGRKMEGGQKIGAGAKRAECSAAGLILGADDLCIPIWNRARA